MPNRDLPNWPVDAVFWPGARVECNESPHDQGIGVIVAYNFKNNLYKVCFGAARIVDICERIGDILVELGLYTESVNTNPAVMYKNICNEEWCFCVADERKVFEIAAKNLVECTSDEIPLQEEPATATTSSSEVEAEVWAGVG